MHSVVNQERRRPAVVSQNPQGDIGIRFFSIGGARHLRGSLDEGIQQVRLKSADLPLNDGGHALQTHPGVNGRTG